MKKILLTFIASFCAILFYANAQNIVFPPSAEGLGWVDVTKAPYNAPKDGIGDATAALNAALVANIGSGKRIYLPNGTYLISNTIIWPNQANGNLPAGGFLQGQSKTGVTIKLKNNCPGYTDDSFPFGMTMPGRKYSQPNSKYRYGFNGKENDNEVKGEGNQQDYGMRIYDPRLGRFLSVDPITNQYPELTPYQFASNRPIQGIDLDGLEFFPMNPKTPGGMTMKAIAVTAKVVSDKWNNSRGGKFTNGLVNTAFGVAATIGSVEYIGGTGGAGAALGGATALMLSLGEIGIGFAQMTDAIAGKNNKTDALHNSSTIPGLIAYGTGSKYAPFIDAFSALGSTFATSGGIKALMKDGVGLKSAFGAFTESPKLLNALGAIDQVLDVKGFAVESVNLFNNFGIGSDSKVLKFQTLQYKLSHTAQSGDNLTSIAKRLNTSIETLVKQNNISNPDDIKIGQKISYTNTVTAKAP